LRDAAAPLEFAAPYPLVIFELTACGAKGIAHCDVNVFVRVVDRMIVSNDDLRARYGETDADIVQCALLLVSRRPQDEYPSAFNARAEPLEARGKFGNACAQGGGGLDLMKADLQRKCHHRTPIARGDAHLGCVRRP
jgi:hypothetical protein